MTRKCPSLPSKNDCFTREWSKALDRLIQVAEKVYTIADVLLKMDMAFGEFGDLGRIKLVQELGDTLDEVKRLRGE